jgi:hypothetical protein
MALITSVGARYLLTHLYYLTPDFTTIEPFRDRNLNVWRTHGSYALKSSSTTSFKLSVSQREYAATLISEIEHLLNHASEHRAHLFACQATQHDPSPSWMFVSLYYFALYIGMAWTRATNAAIIYLDKDSIREYCRGAPFSPGGGAFRSSLAINEETNGAEVEIRKCNTSHFHEAVWNQVCNEASSATTWIESLSQSRKPTNEELSSIRAFRLFGGQSFKDPLVWPSKLRNAINYRPGFSYRSVVNNNLLNIKSRLGKPAFAKFEHLLQYGEDAKTKIGKAKDPSLVPNEAVDLLIAQSLVLEAFVEEALTELQAVKDINSSAKRLRQRFNKIHCAPSNILSKVNLS